MHWHHKHDIPGCTEHHEEWPDWATTILATFDRMELTLMATVQESVDAATAAITTLVGEVEALKGQISPAADTTALDAAVAAAQAILPAPTPAPAPSPAGLSAADASAPASDGFSVPPPDPSPDAQPDGTVSMPTVPGVPAA